MEPTGERVEVPVVKSIDLKENVPVIVVKPEDLVELEKETEHQYIFSERKVDGSKAKPHSEEAKTDSTPKEETPKLKAEGEKAQTS